MKGDLLLKFLEGLDGGPGLLSDLFGIFTAPYGTSLRGMEYLRSQHRRERAKSRVRTEERRQFANLLYYLQKEKFIEVKENRKKCVLTKQGEKYLALLRSRAKAALPSSRYVQSKHNTEETLKIVAFDIPESMKRKRAWLRAVLKNLEFHMLQRSLWVGKAKLPPSFLEDLRRLQLLSCVKIFFVAKSGNIHPID